MNKRIDVKTRLSELAKGNCIVAININAKIWLNNKSGKLESDILRTVGSLPSIIFSNDIPFSTHDEAVDD